MIVFYWTRPSLFPSRKYSTALQLVPDGQFGHGHHAQSSLGSPPTHTAEWDPTMLETGEQGSYVGTREPSSMSGGGLAPEMGEQSSNRSLVRE